VHRLTEPVTGLRETTRRRQGEPDLRLAGCAALSAGEGKIASRGRIALTRVHDPFTRQWTRVSRSPRPPTAAMKTSDRSPSQTGTRAPSSTTGSASVTKSA